MLLEVNDATLRVVREGPETAPAVLLWHGARCTLKMWDLVVAGLEDRFSTIRFDVRGSGASIPAADSATQYTLEQYAADANAILDHFGVDRCHVWGMAWGSRAALAYCALNPERVISAALYDASIGQADVEAQKAGAQRAVALQTAAGIERFRRPTGWNVHSTPETVPQSLAAAGRFDLRASIPRLTMPLLVATGDHDPNLESSRELVALAPQAELVVFENVGHGSVLQRPDLALDAFLTFQDSL